MTTAGRKGSLRHSGARGISVTSRQKHLPHHCQQLFFKRQLHADSGTDRYTSWLRVRRDCFELFYVIQHSTYASYCLQPPLALSNLATISYAPSSLAIVADVDLLRRQNSMHLKPSSHVKSKVFGTSNPKHSNLHSQHAFPWIQTSSPWFRRYTH